MISSALRAPTAVARAGQQGNARASPICHAHLDRRQGLIAGLAAVVAAPLVAGTPSALAGKPKTREMKPDDFSGFMKAEQLDDIAARATEKLSRQISAADLPTAMQCVLADAASYNASTKTGGMNGSIQYELDRPGNANLKPFVAKLLSIKEELEQEAAAMGSPGGLSLADLEALAAKVAAKKQWKAIKTERTEGSGGVMIATAFASPFDLPLGRTDATEADPEVPVPSMDSSVNEIKTFMNGLGVKDGDAGGNPFKALGLSPKPPFWERVNFVLWTAAQSDPAAAEAKLAEGDSVYAEFKRSYDISRKTITRTDYESDFATYLLKLTNLGAKFDTIRLLHPIQVTSAAF